MFKKFLASVGIGSAKVDTVLATEDFIQGGEVEGQIEAKGGDVEQEISGITLKLMTLKKVESEEHGTSYVSHVLESFVLAEKFTLEPKEEKVIPFSFQLHPENTCDGIVRKPQVFRLVGNRFGY